jgi:hypothetical protein
MDMQTGRETELLSKLLPALSSEQNHFSILKTATAGQSETSVHVYQIIRRHIPEDNK